MRFPLALELRSGSRDDAHRCRSDHSGRGLAERSPITAAPTPYGFRISPATAAEMRLLVSPRGNLARSAPANQRAASGYSVP